LASEKNNHFKFKTFKMIVLITNFIFLNISPQTWNKEATYLFAPGLWSSEHQVAKYCSKYRASTGELVTSQHNFEVIQGKTALSCNFPEISLRKMYKTDDASLRMVPSIVINAILAQFGNYILETSNNHYQITISGKPKGDLSINPYFLNVLNLNFGQMLDIEVIKNNYQEIIKNPELPQDIILYGVSRGAAAAFNFIATEYEGMKQKRIKAIVLESCFDSLANMTYLSSLLSIILPRYEHKGIAPIQPDILESFVNTCNKYGISVLFVSSLTDNRVPYKSTRNLYERVKKAGLKNIDLLTLKKSSHSGYSSDNVQDTLDYLKTVHSFFKKCELPFIPNFLY